MPSSITRLSRRWRPLLACALLACALLACALLAGCRGGSVEALNSGLTLHTLPDCAPDRVERLVVEPLGDFAQQEQAAQARALSADRISFTGLPAETQWYRLRVETPDPDYEAFALGRVGTPSRPLDALVLPLQRTCTVHDEALPSFAGSTMALAGDDLLLAGGLDRAQAATRDARVLRVARHELASDVGDLDVKRAHATALALPDETWVLGGAFEQRAGSPAWDTFERFDLARQTFAGLGRMRVARVAPAALALADGSALVAGGLSEVDGEALASIEAISADGSRAELWSDELPFAAQRLGLLLRDGGSAVAIGVADGKSALARVDPGARGVVKLEAPPLADGALLAPELTVALPGSRLLALELVREENGEKTTGSAYILLADDTFLKMPDPRDGGELSWLVSFAGLERARLLALPDGRVLLTGVLRKQPVARLLDPARRDVATRALDIEVERLFLRADGSVLMVGEQGVRILREDGRSAFDNPGGNLLADDSGALCLDAYGRFTREGLGLRSAVADARLDLVPLRFRDVRISVEVEGPADLVLTRADGARRSIALGVERVGPAFCKLEVGTGQSLEIERREERVVLRADGRAHSCQLDGLTGPIAIALRALAADVLIKDLRATRL